VIFESFKHTEEDKRDFVRQIGVDELENSVADNNQDSKKRKIRFEGLPPPVLTNLTFPGFLKVKFSVFYVYLVLLSFYVCRISTI